MSTHTFVEVSSGAWAVLAPHGGWFRNNAGAIVGDGTATLIDTCANEELTRGLLDGLSEIAPGGVDLLINTHGHGDHTNGNSLVDCGTVLAHPACREQVEQTKIEEYDVLFEGIEWGNIHPRPANLTIEDRCELRQGDLVVEVIWVGLTAHTAGDLIVWLPEHRVLYTGDLVFNGGMPLLLQGSITGSVTAMQTLRDLQPDVIVPGHGPLTDTTVLDRLERYCEEVIDLAQRGIDAGMIPAEAAAQTTPEWWSELDEGERLVANLHRAYVDLDAPDFEFNMMQGFREMADAAGGAPIRCCL